MSDPQPKYRSFPASPHIADYVKRYMYVEPDSLVDGSMYPAPTGCGYIGYLFSGHAWATVDGINTSSSTGLHLCCQIDQRHFEVFYQGHVGHIMAELTATGLYRLFGVATGSLTHLWHEFEDVIDPDSARKLKENLSLASTRDEKITAFDHFFETTAESANSPVKYVDEAVRMIEKSKGRITIAALCKNLSMTERNLSRVFKKIVGVSPKFYARAVQLNIIMSKLMECNNKTLSELATECGYYDQAHLTKTMQSFISQSPKDFSECNPHMLHEFMGRSEFLKE